MQAGEAADLAIFVVCTSLLAGYVLFYFNVGAFTVPFLHRRYVNLISLNRSSRGEWVQLLAQDPKEGINAGAAHGADYICSIKQPCLSCCCCMLLHRLADHL